MDRFSHLKIRNDFWVDRFGYANFLDPYFRDDKFIFYKR